MGDDTRLLATRFVAGQKGDQGTIDFAQVATNVFDVLHYSSPRKARCWREANRVPSSISAVRWRDLRVSMTVRRRAKSRWSAIGGRGMGRSRRPGPLKFCCAAWRDLLTTIALIDGEVS